MSPPVQRKTVQIQARSFHCPEARSEAWLLLVRWSRCAAEIGRLDILSGLDDRAANRAGAREIGEQMIAITGPNRSLQGHQFLDETAEDLDRRAFIGKEHIAPHHRV